MPPSPPCSRRTPTGSTSTTSRTPGTSGRRKRRRSTNGPGSRRSPSPADGGPDSHATTGGALLDGMLAAVRRTHADAPERAGAESSELANGAGRSREVAAAAIGSLVRDGRLVREGRFLRAPEHEPQLSSRDAALWSKVSLHLGEEAVKPPVLAELAGARSGWTGASSPSSSAGRRGGGSSSRWRRTASSIRARSGAWRRSRKGSPPPPTTAVSTRGAFRDRSGIGRNLTIQVLEYFDAAGLTRRIGDARIVVRRAADLFG